MSDPTNKNENILLYPNDEEEENDGLKKNNFEEFEENNLNKNENNENELNNDENDFEEEIQNPFLKKAKQRDDIDDIKYNPEPFLTPEMKKGKIMYYSKMQKAIDSYNKIKKQINNTILNKTPLNYAESSHKITIMLDNMNKLNEILTTIIDSGRILTNKKITSYNNNQNIKNQNKEDKNINIEDTNEKLINMYKKEYEKVKARYEQITSDDYIENKKNAIKELNSQIEILEKDNKAMRRILKINDSSYKKEFSGDLNPNNLKEKLNDFEKFNNIYNNLMKKIENEQQSSKNYEIKLKNLEERQQELETMAKDMYGINEFENVKTLEKKEQQKKSDIYKLKRQIEVIDKSINSSKKKYENEFKSNENYINNLNNTKNELLKIFKDKKEQLEKQEQNIKNIEDEIDKLNLLENENTIETTPNEERKMFLEREYKYIQTTNNNNPEKDMILKNLDIQSKEEELRHEQQEILNNSIVLKKNMNLKPNFSFKPGLMGDDNKLNKSSNIRQNYVKNNLDNGEIKEDIIIDNNNDEIKKNENSQSVDKNNQNNVLNNLRSKVLNTASINNEDLINKDLEKLNDNDDKIDETESNEQAHVFNDMSNKIENMNENNNEEQMNNNNHEYMENEEIQN
jgi:hypothetical protein